MNLVKKLTTWNTKLLKRNTGVPKSTLQTWSDKLDSKEKVPRYATIMLEALIEVQELKKRDEAVKKVFEMYNVN